MIGASPAAFQHCEPIFRTLAPPEATPTWAPAAPALVKMVHNGSSTDCSRPYAEGYEILTPLTISRLTWAIAKLWNHGSGGALLLNELAERAFSRDDQLAAVPGLRGGLGARGADGGGGDAPRRAGAVSRCRCSRDSALPPGGVLRRQVIAALRHEFGGHAVQTK